MPMTESTTPSPQPSSAGLRVIGTGAPGTGSRPVLAEDKAVIGVFPDLDSAQAAAEKLAAAGFPTNRLSIVGKDLQSETRFNGFVTTGEVAGPAAATGAWVGGLFGLLAGTALLFVPGAGPLVVLGPLAAAAIGAAEGALVGGGVGAILGHFVAQQHIPKYEQFVRAGNYLLVAYGPEQNVAQAEQVLNDSGATDVQRHDDYRAGVGPIADVREGMRVIDSTGHEVGRVTVVKMGDPEAVTTQGQTLGLDEAGLDISRPDLPPELAERLLRVGFVKVDRKGLFRKDAYIPADQIDRVEDNIVRLGVSQDALMTGA